MYSWRIFTRRIYWNYVLWTIDIFAVQWRLCYRLFSRFISISLLQMSKQKRHRKELSRKKRDTNGRCHHSLTLFPRFLRTSLRRMSSNLFFRLYRSQQIFYPFICYRDLNIISYKNHNFRNKIFWEKIRRHYFRTNLHIYINVIPSPYSISILPCSISFPVNNSGNNYQPNNCREHFYESFYQLFTILNGAINKQVSRKTKDRK